MGEIDQMSTNTSRCSTCCAANVYISVYILIGARIVPLKHNIPLSTKICLCFSFSPLTACAKKHMSTLYLKHC